MNEDAIQTFIYNWLVSAAPQVNANNIIRDYQAKPESEPWIAYAIQSTQQIGYDDKRGLDVNNVMQYGGNRKATIRISYFGPSPMQYAQSIQTTLELWKVQQSFSVAGIAYQKKNPVQNTSYLLESRYQLRADFDFQIEFLDQYSEDEGFILTAQASGKITGAGPEVDEDINIG